MTQTAQTIAARLDRLPMTRRLWRLVLLISLGAGFEFYDIFFTAYVAPGMVKAGLFTPQSLGPFGGLTDLLGKGPATFVFATFAGLFVGAILFGALADRLGRRRVFLGALAWYSITTCILAFQKTGFALDVWRFISGVGLGVQMVTISTFLSEIVPRQVRGPASAARAGGLALGHADRFGRCPGRICDPRADPGIPPLASAARQDRRG
jgi:MFS transporter, putative metabolite:H+ symporter